MVIILETYLSSLLHEHLLALAVRMNIPLNANEAGEQLIKRREDKATVGGITSIKQLTNLIYTERIPSPTDVYEKGRGASIKTPSSFLLDSVTAETDIFVYLREFVTYLMLKGYPQDLKSKIW